LAAKLKNKNELNELRRRALELIKIINEEEKELIKEIIEESPNSCMYLGYIPVHLRGSIKI